MPDIVRKVAISIPSEGHTLPEAYDNHLVLSFHLGRLQEQWKHEQRPIRYEFFWHTTGRIMTAMAREKLVQAALDAEMDYILMYDDDMLLPIDMVEQMLYDTEQHPEIDVLAPLAFMRNPPHYAVIYNLFDDFDPKTHKSFTYTDFVRKYPRNTLVECDAVGFGAVLIKMDLVRRMTPPYFFSTTGSGEDIYFCIKAKKLDARVFMDTRIKLGHLATPQIIDEDYFDKWLKENKHELPPSHHKYLSFSGKEDDGS
jgi:hypothetical protein